MANDDSNTNSRTLSRRHVLSLGVTVAGGFAGAAIAGCAMPGSGLSGTPGSNQIDNPMANRFRPFGNSFPSDVQHEIEKIINAKGMVSNGVLTIEIDRDDIRGVTIHGTPIYPSFEVNGTLNFQSAAGNNVAMNSDLCLKRSEIDPFIDQLLKGGIVFQAEHQHFYDFHPILFFIHFRANGDATTIASAIKAALNVTSTPFPQAPPKNPKTPLPAQQMGKIIGATPTVGAKGVVTFEVPRANQMKLGGFYINPYLNVATSIAFEPLDSSGKHCAAASDYGMIASEIQKVVAQMRSLSWDSGCLYNQETDEDPQLYFDHMYKTGDPIQLAKEIRTGLNLMNVDCSK